MDEDSEQVIRHTDPREPELVAPDLHPDYDAITAHVERHIGPLTLVFHEIISHDIHLDVLLVDATEDRDFKTLITCGMSEKPMAAPEDEFRFAELLLCLPPDWPLDDESQRDERHYWPIRLLKDLARLPHTYETWLGTGHTIPNGDPPEPYAPGTALCGALIAPPLSTPQEFHVLETPDREIFFFGVVALHEDEMQLKLERGFEALIDPFDKAEVGELVMADRPSALRRRKRFGLF